MAIDVREADVDLDDVPRRFVDGSNVHEAIAWLHDPQGYPVPIVLAELGGICVRAEGRELRREIAIVERAVSMTIDPFPWNEVEEFAAALSGQGLRLITARPPDDEDGRPTMTFDFERMREQTRVGVLHEMACLEEVAWGHGRDLPTIVDGRVGRFYRCGLSRYDVIGVIKQQRADYLHPEGWRVLYELQPGHRTPAFVLPSKHLEVVSWYLKLDGADGELPNWGIDGVLRRDQLHGKPLSLTAHDIQDPSVVDLSSLAAVPSLQRFVVATIFRQLVEDRTGSAAQAGLIYLVTLDELNRFAPRGDDFILAIDEALAQNPFTQATFLSAHGTKEGLHLHRKQPDPMVYFQQGADVFKKHEARQKRLRLVMGACHAGSTIVPLRDLLPMCVTRYTAFQGEPSAGNVSEMIASVVGNKIDLFEDIQDAVETGTVEYKSGMKPSEVLEQLITPALDAHKDDPGRFIKGTNQGGYLFDFIRDKAGKWHEVYTSGEDGPTDRP
jgi:hypothetical protein